MTAIPVLVILTAAVLLGLYLGLLYLRGDRKPALIGFHLLLGVGGLEALVMLLHGTPDGSTTPDDGSLGMTAAAFFAAALISGLTAALLRRSPVTANVILATHAGAGTIGFVLFLAWMSSL